MQQLKACVLANGELKVSSAWAVSYRLLQHFQYVKERPRRLRLGKAACRLPSQGM